MINIMKSVNYQTRRDNFTIYAFLLSIFFMCISFMSDEVGENLNGGFFVTYLGGEGIMMIMLTFTLIMSTRICGWDYSDKTINYEILSGHYRRDVYFSRVFSGLMWGIAGSLAVCVIPVIIVTIFKGWGNNISMSGVAVRYLLVIFPLFRLICEFMFLTFLIRNFVASAVAGFLLFFNVMLAESIADEMMNHKFLFEFSMSNIQALFDFTRTSGFADGKDITVYVTDISPSMIIGTIAVSLAAGLALILAGYLIFVKRDME